MDSFFIYVTGFAVLLLIVCLIGVGLLMRFQSAKDTFPPTFNDCPDGWTNSSGTACTPPSTSTVVYSIPTGSGIINTDTTVSGVTKTTSVNFGTATECVKRKWANNNKIAWDGISNRTNCK